MKNIFNNRNFMVLWLGQLVEQFGDSLTLMSLIAWSMSMRENGSAAGNMSLLMLWIGLPIILLGPFAGVVIDRFKRKPTLLAAAAARGVLIYLIYLLVGDNARGAYIYMVVFFLSVVSQFFIPAKSSIIPDIVHNDDLLHANSLSATTTVIVQILTYAAGGILIAEIGHKQALLINVFVYAVVVAVLSFLKVNEKTKPASRTSARAVFEELKDGIKFLLGNIHVMFVVRRVFILMITIGFFYVALTGNFLDEILVTSKTQMKDIKALGFMQGFLGIGLVLGMFMVNQVLKWINEKALIRLLFPLLGLMITALYFVRDFYFMLGIAVVAGMAAVMILGIAETSIQKNTPEELRGRIFSAYYILRGAGLAAATSLTGVLAKFIKEEHIVLLAGLGLLAYGSVNFFNMMFAKKKTE
jgi:DHA3 family macrolide efflux protein-like MFS transporter